MFRTSVLLVVAFAALGVRAATPTPTPTPMDMGSMPGMDVKPKATPTPTPMDMGSMPGMKMSPSSTPTPSGGMSNMPGMNMGGMEQMKMSSTANVGDPMAREASGTSWNPDSSPMHAHTKTNPDGSMWMFMGVGFVRYTRIGSSRDVSIAGKGDRAKFDAPTMFMAMYSRPFAKSWQYGFRAMASLDPIFERGYGYPLLYQTGEEYKGQPIHDRQHPHDLVSELAVTFSHKFNERRSVYFYFGYPGEPALGPPVYLHRVSGSNIPDAPIGHHWQDSTHITFGVVTGGYSFGKAKVEASVFNGREPDSNRWNFDRPRLDSFSGRFSFNPTKNWSMQISHGYLKNPERAEPDVRILRRTTASAIYNKKLGDTRNWATSFVWGQNYANRLRTNAFLAESNYDFGRNAVFARFETVQKTGQDLVLPTPFDPRSIFGVQVLSAGYIRDIVRDKGIDVGLGGMFTADWNPSSLVPVYGGTSHGGWQLFMRLRPSGHE